MHFNALLLPFRDIFTSFFFVSILTMMATPSLNATVPDIAEKISRLPLPRRLKRGLAPEH
jgi:hypothetical protein